MEAMGVAKIATSIIGGIGLAKDGISALKEVEKVLGVECKDLIPKFNKAIVSKVTTFKEADRPLVKTAFTETTTILEGSKENNITINNDSSVLLDKYIEDTSDIEDKYKNSIENDEKQDNMEVEKDDIERADKPDINEKEKIVDEYKKELKEKSQAPETIDDIDFSDIKKEPVEVTVEKRSDFNRNREKYIKEWEERTGKEWPIYKENVYGKEGQIVRRAGGKMEAHHIKPISLGGENSGSNITPMHYKDHNDHQGIHSKDSSYKRLENYAKSQEEN